MMKIGLITFSSSHPLFQRLATSGMYDREESRFNLSILHGNCGTSTCGCQVARIHKNDRLLIGPYYFWTSKGTPSCLSPYNFSFSPSFNTIQSVFHVLAHLQLTHSAVFQKWRKAGRVKLTKWRNKRFHYYTNFLLFLDRTCFSHNMHSPSYLLSGRIR